MSSQQQLKGDNLRRQLELSREYADRNDLLLDGTLRDIGISAWAGDNIKDGALGRFVTMIKSGEVKRGSYLLVESLDRLSRRQVRFAAPPLLN
jgi:DNA invertase Pin-like site-specific DNA recombinase